MTNKYLPLFQPTKIGRMELKNRIVIPPITTLHNDKDGEFTERGVQYMKRRAQGGAAMFITDACFPAGDAHTGSFRYNGMISKPRIGQIVELLHAYDTKLCVQLSGGQGRVCSFHNGLPEKGPSENPCLYNPEVLTPEMTKEDIKESIAKIVDLAVELASAGVDAFDIHAHNGYLIDQFMSPQWNRRTDEYGGSPENRMRYAVEVVRGIKEKLGEDFPVFFRISVDQIIEGFRTVEETIPLIKILVDAGVDGLDVDAGVYECVDDMFPSYYKGDATNLYVARAIREAGIDIPILCAGNMTPDIALAAVEEGILDYPMFGRSIVAEPDLANKLMNGCMEDIKPCIRCNEYCVGGTASGVGLGCAVNAQAANEAYTEIVPTNEPKKVVVVGGGPGGLEAAVTAAKKGHDVTIYEKDNKLGGMINAAATPDFKSQLRMLITWYEYQVQKLGIKIELNTEVKANDEVLRNADQIIVATGSSEMVPPIPGIDGENVVKVVAAHHDNSLLKGDKIVIAGGGLSGCDFGLELAKAGKDVTIVEMLPVVGGAMQAPNYLALLKELAKYNITTLTQHRIKEFNAQGVLVEFEGVEKTIECDSVVIAFGSKPNRELADAIRAMYPTKTRLIGDCNRVGKVGMAIREGFHAGNTIE